MTASPLRRAACLLVALLVLGAAGCGRPRAPRPPGPFQALRLRRDVPAHGHLTPRDVELVPVADEGLPRTQAYPRSIEEVLGAAVRTQRRAGTLLLDEHLEHHPLAPEPGAASLLQGELGMMVPILDLPWEAEVGQFVEIAGFDFPLRLAAASPPSRDERQALLAAPYEVLHPALRDLPTLPIQYLRTAFCGEGGCHQEAPGFQPADPRGEPREVHVLARDVPAGKVLETEDLRPFRVAASLLPEAPVPSSRVVTGQVATQTLVPGEILLEEHLTTQTEPAEAVKLYVRGLYPDWVHPGGRFRILRPHIEFPPTPLDVLDMDRAPLGAPIPVECRPVYGYEWPKAPRKRTHTHKHGESGHEAWLPVVQR